MNNKLDFYNSNSYSKNGFTIIEEVLNEKEVLSLRASLYDHFNTNKEKSFETIDYVLDSKIAALFFNKKVVRRLKQIIGEEVVFINDFDLQYNAFGTGGAAEGLHTDSNSEFSIKNKYLFRSDYMFGKIGLYLQDNTEEFGGGIDVVVRSHRVWSRFPIPFLNYLFTRLYLKLHKINNKRRIRVPIKAGSAVFFDSRLLHASSKPNDFDLTEEEAKAKRANLPSQNCKYTIYMDVCSPSGKNQFLDNAYKRALSEDRSVSESDSFFTKYLSFTFPEDFPDYYKTLADKNKIQVATLSKKRLRNIRNKNKEKR